MIWIIERLIMIYHDIIELNFRFTLIFCVGTEDGSYQSGESIPWKIIELYNYNSEETWVFAYDSLLTELAVHLYEMFDVRPEGTLK